MPQTPLDPQQSLGALLFHRHLRGGIKGHHVLGERHLALGRTPSPHAPPRPPEPPGAGPPLPAGRPGAVGPTLPRAPPAPRRWAAPRPRLRAPAASSSCARACSGGRGWVRRGCQTPRDPRGGAAPLHLHHEAGAAPAEALQHAEEEVGRLHQVPQEAARLLGLVELAEEGEEELPVLHQVEDVAWGGGVLCPALGSPVQER